MDSKSMHGYQKIERSERGKVVFTGYNVIDRYSFLLLGYYLIVAYFYLDQFKAIRVISILKDTNAYQIFGLMN